MVWGFLDTAGARARARARAAAVVVGPRLSVSVVHLLLLRRLCPPSVLLMPSLAKRFVPPPTSPVYPPTTHIVFLRCLRHIMVHPRRPGPVRRESTTHVALNLRPPPRFFLTVPPSVRISLVCMYYVPSLSFSPLHVMCVYTLAVSGGRFRFDSFTLCSGATRGSAFCVLVFFCPPLPPCA